MLNGSVNTELYFIYGLIVVVILLIITVLIIDRKDAKRDRRRIKLTDTLNMKPITDDMIRDSKYQDDVELIEIESKEEEQYNTKSIPEIKIDLEKAGLLEEEDEIYHDTELEKTQAQIRVEEITKALENAKVDEKIEEEKDKYADYEEEQEKNAFISYDELKDNYDRLYEENEKTQYVEDNTIPINIKELYEAAEQEGYTPDNKIEVPEELTFDEEPKHARLSDTEITNASSFLSNLKELRDNLD